MTMQHLSGAALACVLALTLSACGEGRSNADEAAPAETSDGSESAVSDAEPAPIAPAADPSATATAPVTVPDIDRWQRGMLAELEAVRAGGDKLKQARTNEDTLSAMMAVQENATQGAGARAADLDLERYRSIRSELSAAVSYLTPELGGIDTTMLSSAQRAELRESNQAQLKQMEDRVPTEVVEALRPRAAELRKQNLALVGARLKAAGM